MATPSPAASAEERSLLGRTAALIVNYNTGDVLLRCLRTIQPGRLGLETVVVDNGSTDGGVEAIRPEFSATTIVEAGRDLGFGGGINQAGRQTHLEDFLILNPDRFTQPAHVPPLPPPPPRSPPLALPTPPPPRGL